MLRGIQVLHNAVGGGVGGCQISHKNVTNMYGLMLSALQGGGWVSIFQEKTLRNAAKQPHT